MSFICDSSKPGFYFYSRCTRGHAGVEEFLSEFGYWLPTLDEISLPRLAGEMLFDAVHAKSPSAGGFDGWGWKGLGALSVGWFDGLAEVSVLMEESGMWPEHLRDAHIVIIPKEGGDVTPIGRRRPLSVLPFVYSLWPTVRLGHLQD